MLFRSHGVYREEYPPNANFRAASFTYLCRFAVGLLRAIRPAGAHLIFQEVALFSAFVKTTLAVRSLLEVVGCVVEVANDGRAAVDAVGAAPFDIVLMDLQMPVLDGVDATTAIRRRPERARLPIVAMTANVFARDRERCLSAGMQEVLTKPIDPSKFYAALERHLLLG